jgi:hypothetical protein
MARHPIWMLNLVNRGQIMFGWNQTAGRGEADFVANRALDDAGRYAFSIGMTDNIKKKL